MDSVALNRAEALLDEMSTDEQLTLLERVARRLRGSSVVSRHPDDLLGLWAGCFPDGFDVDKALGEIRRGWLDGNGGLAP